MKRGWALGIALFMAGCGPQYTIPSYETGDIERVVSSGHSPKSCLEHLNEDAKELKVNVRLTDMHHESTSGPIAWLYNYSYVCTGKVLRS